MLTHVLAFSGGRGWESKFDRLHPFDLIVSMQFFSLTGESVVNQSAFDSDGSFYYLSEYLNDLSGMFPSGDSDSLSSLYDYEDFITALPTVRNVSCSPLPGK